MIVPCRTAVAILVIKNNWRVDGERTYVESDQVICQHFGHVGFARYGGNVSRELSVYLSYKISRNCVRDFKNNFRVCLLTVA